MTPDERQRRSAGKKAKPPDISFMARLGPTSDDSHEVVYFQRNRDDDPNEASPGRDFLRSCPSKVRATMRAVVAQVAAAPPKRFAGGGYWEAMSGEMNGWFEERVDGPQRRHYRLFCRLDYEAIGRAKPLLVIVDGRSKPFRTTLSDSDYNAVRKLGEEYFSRNPRSLA